jgi:hypothetical protein
MPSGGIGGTPGSIFLAPAMAESTWVMSTSPTNADDRLAHAAQSDHAAQSFPCVKDQGLLSALASVPDCAFPGAAGRSAGRTSDDPDSAQATGYLPVTEPQVQRLDDQPPPRGLSPASVTVISNRGYVGTPMLRRRHRSLARARKLLVASAIGATLAGCVAVEIWLLVGASDLAGLPQPVPRSALPAALPPELGALTTASQAARVASPQSAAALQPTPQQEGQRADSTIGAPLAQTSTAGTPPAPWLAIPQLSPISRPGPPAIARPQPITALEGQSIAMASSTPIEKIAPPPTPAPQPRSAATSDLTPIARAEPTPTPTPQPRAIAMAESSWIGRLGPALESPRINQAAPRLGKAAGRASLLFNDSDVRYLSRAELETLSADQLHIARNEIFARRGRFFKDDALRAYFLQFPWYRPHAWEVPLSPVEFANVALIQSVEEADPGSASAARVAASRGIAGPRPAQTQAENGDPFADRGRRYLMPEELQGLSADQLAIVRNQIFARRGRYFKDDWLRAYFSQFPWYRPYAWEVPLSPLEQANVKLVQSLEQTAAAARPALRTGRGPPM